MGIPQSRCRAPASCESRGLGEPGDVSFSQARWNGEASKGLPVSIQRGGTTFMLFRSNLAPYRIHLTNVVWKCTSICQTARCWTKYILVKPSDSKSEVGDIGIRTLSIVGVRVREGLKYNTRYCICARSTFYVVLVCVVYSLVWYWKD